jgi:hypothetical protein
VLVAQWVELVVQMPNSQKVSRKRQIVDANGFEMVQHSPSGKVDLSYLASVGEIPGEDAATESLDLEAFGAY